MNPITERIVQLTQLALRLNASPDNKAALPHEQTLAAFAVLALEGDATARAALLGELTKMAECEWGIRAFRLGGGLGDCFAMRSVIEAYKGLIAAGLAGEEHQRHIAPWLHRFALIRANGEIETLPGFAAWHQRNQCVPATCVYEIADLLDHGPMRGTFDTAPLWRWADANMVGWDFTWRTPDDAWLYQFIWTWSAYRHAALRRPDLLHSENARRSFAFYKHLSVPGGHTLVFGDTRPGDHLGPLVSLLLGASLFDDAEQLWIGQELFAQAGTLAAPAMLCGRLPEMYRIYHLWPRHLEAVRPRGLVSTLLNSPLAGRGWSLDETPYNDSVKQSHPAFPNRGRDTCNYDDVYQIRDPAAYAETRPDKLVFREGFEPGSLFALVDLRAHGLHDHPDALGVTTLICDQVPWLVETTYVPRGFNRQRWLHNVPLYRRGAHAADGLKTWQCDTWREALPGDVWLETRGANVLAAARLRHDSFDYVDLDGDLFDVERVFLFVPGQMFLVIDRLIAAADAEATVGQAWHSASTVHLRDNAATFMRAEHRFTARFAQSRAMTWDLSQHTGSEQDAFYFPAPVQDLLCHGAFHLKQGDMISFAAAFGRNTPPVRIEQSDLRTTVTCGAYRLAIESFRQVTVVSDDGTGRGR